MVQRRDLNAPPGRKMANIVRELRQQAEASKTGAHGVKDMGTTGNSSWTRPDGTVANVREVDADLAAAQGRIDAALAELAESQQRLDAAEAAAQAAQARLDTVENVTIPGAVADLEAADTAAQQDLVQLEENLAAANAELADARTDLDTLETVTLPTLQSTLEAADAAARADLDDLDGRLAAVDGETSGALAQIRIDLDAARQVASNAKTAAETANTAANAASQAALEAAGIAASKGRVIVQETEPQGEDRNAANIWIQPVLDDPATEVQEKAVTYVYLEASDEWQPTTSSELAQAAQNALDAREAAQQAQQRADTAVANAAAAQSAAEAAQQTADQATLDAANAHNAAVDLSEAAEQAAKEHADLVADGAEQAAIDAAEVRAQQLADAAQAAAEAAAEAALGAARTEIDQAILSSANGKNTVTTSTAAPTSSTPGVRPGDVWWRVDGAGVVFGQWTWSGTAWVARTIRSEVIANLDVSKLVVTGSATMAQAVIDKLWVDGLVAKSAVFQQINVASGNILIDPNGLNPDLRNKVGGGRFVWNDTGKWWEALGSNVVQGGITQYNAFVGTGNNYDSNLLTAGAMYAISFEVWPDKVGVDTMGRAAIYYRRFDGTTAYVGDGIEPGGDEEHYDPPMIAGQWNKVTRFWRAPDDASSGAFALQIVRNATDATELRLRNPFVGKQASTVLIEDGAVNAQKVNAQSVAGAVGQFLELTTDQLVAGAAAIDVAVINKLFAEIFAAHKITATELVIAALDSDGDLADGSVSAVTIADGAVTTQKLTVTEEMAATLAAFMSVETKNLIVTEAAILQHATLLGETVVDQINVLGKLIGVDGVFTGMVDFANINVTSQALVNVLAASAISADKIDVTDLAADMMLAGLIRTGTTGRRVEIKPAGLAAFNAAGQQTVSINGTTNFISGTISTGRAGMPAAVLTPVVSGSQVGGGVWFSQDGSLGDDQAAIYSLLDGNIHIRPKDSLPKGSVFIDGNLVVGDKTSFAGHVTAPGFVTTGTTTTGTLKVSGNASVDKVFYCDSLYVYHPGSASGSANARINSDGSLTIASSSRRYKTEVEDWAPDAESVLALQPRSWVPRDDDPDLGFTANGRYVGFIAEEVEDAGLEDLVAYSLDDYGNRQPESLNYDRFAAAQQTVLRKHDAELEELRADNEDLRSRLAMLEALIMGGNE